MMKKSANPSLMVLCGFILGYICFFVPGTKIHYQVNNGTEIITQEGFGSVFGDRYGTDAFPCSLARFESVPSSQFLNLLLVWQAIGKVLNIMAVSFGLSYITRAKIPLSKFFALIAILMGGPVAIGLTFFNKLQPMCDSNDFYKIISFTPYLPFVLVLIAAFSLGYIGTRMAQKTDVATTG